MGGTGATRWPDKNRSANLRTCGCTIDHGFSGRPCCQPDAYPVTVVCESGKSPGRQRAVVAVPAGGARGRRIAGNVLPWCWLRCGRRYHQHAGGRGIRKLGNVVWFRPTVRAMLAGVELGFLLVDPPQVAARHDHQLSIGQLH